MIIILAFGFYDGEHIMGNGIYRVYVQTNDKQLFGAKLSAYSLLKNCATPQLLEVKILNVKNYPIIEEKHGKTYLRKGVKRKWDKTDLQSFTLTRFLPPFLQNFSGRALVIDPDVFASKLCDIVDLFETTSSDKGIYCVPQKSSVMLLDCSKLLHWDFPKNIQELFELKRDYRDWMSLKLEDPSSIGDLSSVWNDCDHLTSETRLIHFTRRVTQPWKTGLKVDFNYDNQGGPIKRAIRKILKKKNTEDYYIQNPYSDQVDFFFDLMKNAIEDNAITLFDLEKNISQGFVRSDLINYLK